MILVQKKDLPDISLSGRSGSLSWDELSLSLYSVFTRALVNVYVL